MKKMNWINQTQKYGKALEGNSKDQESCCFFPITDVVILVLILIYIATIKMQLTQTKPKVKNSWNKFKLAIFLWIFNGERPAAQFVLVKWWANKQLEVCSSHLYANLPFCFPVSGCPCWRSGAVFVTRHSQSSVGLRAASSSMLEALLAGTRPKKEPWRWPVGLCRLLPAHLQMEIAEQLERMANDAFCSVGSIYRKDGKD